MFRRLLERASALLPGECEICRAWPAEPLCQKCIGRFAVATPRCGTCAIEVPAGVERCGRCLLSPPPLDSCFAAVSYSYPWSNCIPAFKYRSQPGWASTFANLLRTTKGVEQAIGRCDLIVPMPLSQQRLRERGFNQALELARCLDPRKTEPALLLRIRDTPPQNVLDRRARMHNVAGAFALDPLRPDAGHGRRILLVDDVMTSGASIFSAASTLRAAGAAEVTALVIARTAEPQDDPPPPS